MNTERVQSEYAWRNDRDENGWILPKPAWWVLRLWGIRHLRGAFLESKAENFAKAFCSIGIGLGQISQYDRWIIYAIKRGWM